MANGTANCGILAIGLDAAEPSLVRRWAAAGLLPSIAGLIAAGATRPLRLEPGLYAGSVWPSLFTGRSAGAHGRYNYLKLQPGGYAERRLDPDMPGAEPFWMRLSRAGLHTMLLDIPKMPLPDRFQGTLVSDWGTHDPERPMTALPAEIAAEVISTAGIDPVGNCDHFMSRSPAREELADALCERARRRTALALHLLEKAPSDLAFLVYSEPHCGGHHLWAAHNAAEAAGRGDDPGANPYLRVLQAIDRGIERLLAAVGRRTPVLVVLSHGMGDHNDATHLLDRALRRLDGWRARRRPLRLAAAALFRLHRQLPRRLGDPVRPALLRFIDGALARDRARRRWFQLATNDNAAGIRLNVVGREPQGLIAPGPEFDRTLELLRQRLLGLENPATGSPALRDVIETRQAFRGERTGELPDLVLLWNREHPFEGLRAPWLGELRGRYRGRRVGDHRGEGLLIAAAPGLLDDGARPALSAMAFAPTITAALGLPGDGFDDAPFMPFVEAARRAGPGGAAPRRWPMPSDADHGRTAAAPPRVSVVIRSYNCRPYIGQAIESALAQDHPALEIVVVDDGSTDGTPEILERYRARATILLQANGGQASAINAGFAASTGAILLFLDGDDRLDPGAVTAILAAWRPGTVRVSSPLRVIDPGGRPIGRSLSPESCEGFDRAAIFRHPELAPHVSTSGNAFARAALARILPMPTEDWRQAPDIYLNVMSALAGPVQVMPAPLASYRIHPASVSINWPDSLALLRDRTLLYGRLEARARALGLAPIGGAAMTPSLRQALLRVLSWRLDPERHAFPDDTRSRLAGGLLRSFRCPGRMGPRHWRRSLLTMIALALLVLPAGVIRARYPQILVGPRYRSALRRYRAAAAA